MTQEKEQDMIEEALREAQFWERLRNLPDDTAPYLRNPGHGFQPEEAYGSGSCGDGRIGNCDA